MGSDLMRWMYCRTNPAANINFGPHLAEEVRSKFIMKLWNTYAFFCNYARLDEFDPAAPQVPLKDRPDIDRWILSDLQLLIKAAHDAFTSYDVMAFCLKAEEFVDDKLSNWYVRRNRRRFWKSEKGADKLAAYQTLYSVLVTLMKLCAPVIPFMTEKMYRNLGEPNRVSGRVESVHLCDYPKVDEALIDHELSEEMDALLRLVSLGGSARNAVKIKVRQPLAEIKIQPASDAERKAVERFADQIRDELNIKKVTLHDPKSGPLLAFDYKLNPKSCGPKFGPRLSLVQQALAKAVADHATSVSHELAEVLQVKGSISLVLSDGSIAILEPADLWITPKVEKGWGGIADHGTQILLDGRITPALELEGLAREVIRHVQNARKDAELEMDDRIVLYLATDDAKLAEAIKVHRDYIASETLVAEWATGPLGAGAYRTEVKIEGAKLVIELKKK